MVRNASRTTQEQIPTSYGGHSPYESQAEPPPDVPSGTEGRMNWGTLRPQIFISIICATVFSVVALFVGVALDAVEVVTAVVGSFIGFLAGVSLKVLESE